MGPVLVRCGRPLFSPLYFGRSTLSPCFLAQLHQLPGGRANKARAETRLRNGVLTDYPIRGGQKRVYKMGQYFQLPLDSTTTKYYRGVLYQRLSYLFVFPVVAGKLEIAMGYQKVLVVAENVWLLL